MREIELKPGESIPFPNTMKDCKICIRNVGDTDFSNLIPVKKVIFNTAVGYTVSSINVLEFRIILDQVLPLQ